MAAPKVRRWRVEPDQVMATSTGEIVCVSRQAITEAIMDGEALLARMGGIFEVRVKRERTDLPGEAVTTAAVCAWYDGDAARAEVLPAPLQEPEPDDEALVEGMEQAAVATVPDSPDGLDESTLEEEDVSAIPESVR